MSLLKSCIHFINLWSKPKKLSVLYKNFHDTESNAFSNFNFFTPQPRVAISLYCKEYSLFLAKWKITLYYSIFQALLFIFRKALYVLFIFGVEVVHLRQLPSIIFLRCFGTPCCSTNFKWIVTVCAYVFIA